jgi:hypothetical protein
MIDPSRVLVWNFELGEMACLPAPALPNALKWVPDHVAVIYCVRTLYYWLKAAQHLISVGVFAYQLPSEAC